MMQPSPAMTKVRWSQTSGPNVRAEPPLGEGHADRIGEALAERAGRDFDPGGMAELGMPRRPASELAELAQVLQREVVAGQVEHGVLQDAGVAARQDEAVAIGPLRMERVVAHDARPQHVGEGGQRHRRTGVPGVALVRAHPWRGPG